MQLAMIGLGRMGASMVRRLLRKGHDCVVFDRSGPALAASQTDGATAATSVAELFEKMTRPRAVCLAQLAPHLQAGDTVIDGGNSCYHDDIRRAADLAAAGQHHVDVGISGGVAGGDRGYCLMIGGEAPVVAHLTPIFAALAPGAGSVGRTHGRSGALGDAEQGFLHCGPHGAGHFGKMVHNGIEYGLMAADAEGLNVLRNEALLADPQLAAYGGRVADSGEGRWTIEAAIDEGLPTPVLGAALYARFASRGQADFASQLLSAMRHAFGRHVEKPPKRPPEGAS